MRKNLFWAGLGFQAIQLTALGIIFLSQVDWSFANNGFFVGLIFVILNIGSLAFMLIGAIGDDPEKKTSDKEIVVEIAKKKKR